ncbi:MAG: cytochrome c maturation protein CcmE [Chloroflexaceae bacterium]|nr:cytochrome c maturation protein CcmE [Chloroflexaceae bacterium]
MTTTHTQEAPHQSFFGLKPLHLAGIAIILLAIVYGAFGFKDAFLSYSTSVSETRASGRNVQLAGFLGSKGEYDDEGRWTFLLEDRNGEQVKVVYHKVRPSNFDHATSIVAIGRYDPARDVFVANDLLVKCPSKYQEQL